MTGEGDVYVRILCICSTTYGHGSLRGEGKASVREFALPQPVLLVRVGRNLDSFLWDVARLQILQGLVGAENGVRERCDGMVLEFVVDVVADVVVYVDT